MSLRGCASIFLKTHQRSNAPTLYLDVRLLPILTFQNKLEIKQINACFALIIFVHFAVSNDKGDDSGD